MVAASRSVCHAFNLSQCQFKYALRDSFVMVPGLFREEAHYSDRERASID